MFFTDNFVRPFLGDYLVFLLIYCFVKSISSLSVKTAATLTLIFAYGIEVLQYFNLVQMLGLENYKLASVVLGSTFDWLDLLAYTLGFITILFLENLLQSFVKKT